MRTRTLVAITITAATIVGTVIGLTAPLPGRHHYADDDTTYVSHQTPTTNTTNQDAMFYMSISGYVTTAEMPAAKKLAHTFCATLDNGVTPADAIDAALRPLTKASDVYTTTAIIGAAVPSYCDNHTAAFLEAAHKMHGDQLTANV